MKKSYRFLNLALLGFTLLIFLFSCINSKSPKNDKETVKIGAVLPLTGNLSFYGQSEINGLLLAEKQISNKLYDLELIVEDSEGSTAKGVTAAKKLVEHDKVEIVITSLTGTSIAVKEYLKAKGILQICLAMNEEIPKGNQNTFRIYPGIIEEGQEIIKVLKQFEANRIGIIHFEQEAYINQVTNIIIPELGDRSYLVQRFNNIDIDLKNKVIKLKNFGPDVIIVGAYYSQIPAIMKAFTEYEMIGIPIISGLNMAVALNLGIVDLEYFTSTNIAMPQTYFVKDTVRDSFVESYIEQYEAAPNFDATYAYAVFQIINQVIGSNWSHSAGDDPVFVIKDSVFNTVAGTILIDQEGNSLTQWKTVILE